MVGRTGAQFRFFVFCFHSVSDRDIVKIVGLARHRRLENEGATVPGYPGVETVRKAKLKGPTPFGCQM